MNAVETVIWDVETAGVEDHHATIQLAAIAVRGWHEIDSFNVKIRFDEAKADPAALELNSYNAEVWKREAVEPETAIVRFSEWLRGHAALEKKSERTGNTYRVARVAGWNVAFDCRRIERGFKAFGRFLPAASFEALDYLQVARGYFWDREARPENMKLASVAKFLGLDVLGAHDALADVRLVHQIAQVLATHS